MRRDFINLRFSIYIDECVKYGGQIHWMFNKCCSQKCGEYCGGEMAKYCDQGPGGESQCCGSKIPNDKICGGINNNMAPCTLPGMDFYIF